MIGSRATGDGRGRERSPANELADDRYARQSIVRYWNQEALTNAHLLIVGSGPLAAVVATGAAALGVGRVSLQNDALADGRDNFVVALAASTMPSLADPLRDKAVTRVRAMEPALQAINTDVTVRGYSSRLVSTVQWRGDNSPTIAVVTAEGELTGVEASLACLAAQSIPVILVAGSTHEGVCAVRRPGHSEHANLSLLVRQTATGGGEAGSAVALVIGGLALSELLGWLMPSIGHRDGPISAPIWYCPNNRDRFLHGDRTFETRQKQAAGGEPRQHGHGKVVLAGAGGIGTWFGLAAAADRKPGLQQLTIFDNDTISSSNLNRQVLFAGFEGTPPIGHPKSTVLADRLRGIARCCNPELCIEAVETLLTEDTIRDRPAADVVVSGVDTFAARAAMNRACIDHSKPFINAGSGALEAEAMIYSPGQTACLDCAMDIERLARQAPARASCGAAPEPSTVIANMVAAGMAYGELGQIFADPAGVSNGILTFDATSSARVGVRSKRGACSCKIRQP